MKLIRAVLVMALASVSGAALAQNALENFSQPGAVRLDQTGKNPVPPKGPAIVQFWASWCVGCRKTMDMVLESNKEQGLPFFMVSMDEDPAAARNYLQRAGASSDQLQSVTLVDTKQEIATALKITAVPTLLLIDRDGKIAGRIVGHTTPAEIKSLQRSVVSH
ncbi:MAG: TlpA family protein disulfide reductase [Proteobacteria bacterium]|nr:TlpA family protein disulfide reductase [Pseudomonadota bacterium]